MTSRISLFGLDLYFDKRRFFLFFVVVFQILCFASLPVSLAAEAEKKEHSFFQESFQVNLPGRAASEMDHFDRESVKKIQESLKAIGYDVGEVFGLINKKTSAAVRKFREDFEIVSDDLFSNHLIETLFHYAEVAKVHEDWKNISLSQSFTDWINKQPTKEQVRISKLRRSGTAQQIVTLLNAYKDDQTEEKKKDQKQNIQVPKMSIQAEQPLLKETVPTQKSEIKKETDDLPEDAQNPEKTSTDEVETVPVQKAAAIEQAGPPKEESEAEAGAAGQNDAKKEETLAPADSATPEEDEAACTSQEKEVSFKLILELANDCKNFDAEKAVIWEGDNCACLVDFSGKTIYGFYPFWFAGEPQKIDFSQLSRIAYYGLSFDAEGEMSPLLHWHPRTADFVTEAQRYRTKVDLVIYKNDWSEWFHFSTEDQLLVIDKTTKNIVRAVHQKMPNTFENRLKSLMSSKESTTMGDGVTLYFDEYPEDVRAVAFFKVFIKELRRELKAANPNYKLNLMLPMHALGRGIYAYDNLIGFFHDEKTVADDDIDLFLVMLEKPTSPTKKVSGSRLKHDEFYKNLEKFLQDGNAISNNDTDFVLAELPEKMAAKKELRLSFEKDKTFKGYQRRNMLRKIIPVISPVIPGADQSKPEQKQFADDLIYFEDNFGGVGFWPLPFASNKGAEDVQNLVKEVFAQKSDLEFVQGMVPEEACKWICPNRWYFRLAYDLLFGLLFIYGLLALRSAALRNFFKQYRRYFILTLFVAIVILYSAVMCDPYLNSKKDEVTLALIFVGIFFWIWRSYMQMKEAEYP